MLFIVAALLVGSNALANVTETYTFKSGTDKTNHYVTLGESFTNPSVSGVTMKYVLSDPSALNINYARRLAVNKTTWNERPYSGFSYAEASGNRDGYFSLCNMKNGDKFVINYSQSNGSGHPVFKSANATYLVEEAVTAVVVGEESAYLVSGREYTVTALEGATVTVDFYSDRCPVISSIVITTAEATIYEPSFDVQPAAGFAAITITPGAIRGNGTGTVVTKYSYVSAADATSNGTTYTEMLQPTSDGTIYAYSYIDGGASSPVVSKAFEVTEPKLPNPTASLKGMVLNTGYYYKTFTLDTDVSGILGSPSVSYKYSTDQSTWNDLVGTTIECTAGTIYAKAVAAGCEDSDPLTIESGQYIRTQNLDVLDLYGDFWDNGSNEWPTGLDYTLIANVSFNPINNTQGCTYRTRHNSDTYNTLYARNKAFTATCSNLTEDIVAVFADYNGNAYTAMTSTSNSTTIEKNSSLKYYSLYAPVSSTSSITVTAAGWRTLCSPYSLDFTGLGVKAYIITGGTNGHVTTTQVNKVPAQTPLLLEGEGTFNVPMIDKSAAIDATTGNKLVGAPNEKTIDLDSNDDGVSDSYIYVLMNGGNGIGFYKTTATSFTVGANTAYLPANFDATQGARAFFSFGDDATGIRLIENGELKKENSVYDLQGRRIDGSRMNSGIYIHDGRKVFVK